MSEEIAEYLKTLPTTQVELTISCTKLRNESIWSKSDVYCVVLMKEPCQIRFSEIARTEVIKDTLSPEWVTKIVLDYNFETIQKLKFEIRDQDEGGNDDILSVFECTLGELISFAGCRFIGELKGQSNEDYGKIVVVTEEVVSCKQIAEIQFNAQNLPSGGWSCFGETGCDAFLVISRSNVDESFSVVYKTEVVHGRQNPIWEPFTTRVTAISNGDYERTIKIDCYNHKNDGNHELIGTCFTSLGRLCDQNESPMMLVDERKHTQVPKESASFLKVYKARIIEEMTFLDYIRNGTQMHFAVAIDFNSTNRVHTHPNSLHFLSSCRLNDYEIAIRAVGDIIQYYDSSKIFPAFGFGAKIPPHFEDCQQFPLNGNLNNPYCSSIEDILVQYRNQLSKIQLSSQPSHFAPIINNTRSIASKFQNGVHYFVLVIITNGRISDLHETKLEIINASNLPISIIIIGVGDVEFDKMDILDADDALLRANGQCAKRDIVQFVPLKKYLSKTGPDKYINSQANLAKEVLAEIPQQFLSFMKSRETSNVPSSSSTIVPTAPMPENSEEL